MKRCLSLLLTLLLSLTAVPFASADGPDGPPSFPIFDDTPTDAWYYADLLYAYHSGLINGKSETRFAPDDPLTYAEAVKLAACMRQLHDGVSFTPRKDAGVWYEPYVNYCKAYGIIAADYPWNQPATRAGYMEIFAAALPDTDLAPINEIPDGAIHDLGGLSAETTAAIYKLYRAGVLQGTGDDHACAPYASIRRCEVTAILSRMMEPEKRISFTMTVPEHRIETVGGITYVDGILIANKTYSLPADYAPGGLTAECQAALDALSAGAAADGLMIYPISTYRSYAYQAGLYERYAARDGYAEADRYSARPGHSEHQTGLAVDVNSLDYDFAYTPEGIWLAAHCAEYGFILRYPEGKEAVTGYRYEPWHIRYLGTGTAQKVKDSGLTLEEYLGITSAYAD
ncbi:MAG: D-alanyl-D-alanine carboxypeptidase family protein [Clostridiales bacterium]|nr:D-alanyl-D-alanine carboxypeptidase family protein [Clostridiales bacterium]